MALRYIAPFVLAAVIFSLDLMVPRGFAVWLWYIPALFVSRPHGKLLAIEVWIFSVLMLGGAMMSPESSVPVAVVFANRSLGIALMAVVALLLYTGGRMNEALRLAHQRAEEASEAKTRFLGYVSHDMRTPLNAIIARLDVIKADAQTAHVLRDLNYIESHASFLSAFIHELLDYANGNENEIEIAPVSLREVFDSIAALFQPLIPEGVSLDISVSSELEFPTDKRRLQHILLNLIANSVKFTQFGSISVYAAESPAGLHLTIDDTGSGVSQAMLEKMFEHGITGDPDGLGLGLAMTKYFVRFLGGYVSAFSDGPGAGLSVEILIPHPDRRTHHFTTRGNPNRPGQR